VASVGRAWAIIRGRLSGNTEKAKGLLKDTPPLKLMEMNRQEALTRGSARKKKPYKLGERVRTSK